MRMMTEPWKSQGQNRSDVVETEKMIPEKKQTGDGVEVEIIDEGEVRDGPEDPVPVEKV